MLLDGNNLTGIEPKILERLSNSSQISTLTLHDNPWRCDCSAREFLTFVHSNYLEIPDLSEIMCANSNRTLSSLTPEQLCPTSYRMIIVLCSMTSLFALFVGLAAALYYKFQRQIKVWLYSKNLCLCLVTEDELDKDKIYDAFVSYSHKDEDFVIKELVAKLEDGPKPYKLCIHVRDWLAGEWIPTQIARSVEESRRTIIVLSRHFIDSEWGRLEFQAAHKQALNEKRARVVIVIYGDIGPTDNLDPDLKSYLQTNTYVKWGEPWFWQKLRYALPHSKTMLGEQQKNENLAIVAKQIEADKMKNKKAKEAAKVTFVDEEKPKAKDSVIGINMNLGGNFEIRAPQCTTV